jgi:hypothetical protein
MHYFTKWLGHPLLLGIDRHTCDAPSSASKNSRVVSSATAAIQDRAGRRWKQIQQPYIAIVFVDKANVIIHWLFPLPSYFVT